VNQPAAPALAACVRAVDRPPGLSAQARREIAALCERIDDVVEDNEATMSAVCQELALAAAARSRSSRGRLLSECYAEYARTVR
jgi:hypothetical protein